MCQKIGIDYIQISRTTNGFDLYIAKNTNANGNSGSVLKCGFRLLGKAIKIALPRYKKIALYYLAIAA